MRLLSSLTNRIFVASSLLAVLSIGVAIYVVNAAVTSQAEAELQRGLEEAGTLVEQYRTLLFENFTRQARLIADLPRFKAAVAVDDPPTVQPIADEYRTQINADLVLVTNRSGRTLAESGGTGMQGAGDVAQAAIQQALTRREVGSFWPRAGGVLQVVSVPVWIDLDHPEVLGTLSVAFRLDRALALRFRDLTDSEIVFAASGHVQAASMPDTYQAELEGLLQHPGMESVRLGDNEYVTVTRLLSAGGQNGALPVANRSAAAAPFSTGEAPVVIILRSRTERLQFLRTLHTALASTALVAVLAATLLSYGIARTVTRPLGAITATMGEMAATGDLGRKIALPARRWDDEDARVLARTFDAMTESIGRFQREAAQRERLSSLGRLSTVVAHEIRNPLMIIKTSLRTLRRQDVPPERLSAAVTDIDEEVTRLNRIVTEVLDFARPIRLDYGMADLNALCTDAVQAASAGEDGPAISTLLDPKVGQVYTDAERLRIALVNILTNAQHAVQARKHERPASGARSGAESGGAQDPAIELATEALPDARIAIVVRDRGAGIAPENLPRIFDPYFTTKRTGSGLGLAIARNIIESLNGTITAAQRRDHGTEMRIELPVRGAGAPA